MIGFAPRWLRRGNASKPAEPWPLGQRLLRLSPRDDLTIADALTGVIVTGATGSGKSSGPGEALAKAYLRAGFGGVIHTVKPSDVETALRWPQEASGSVCQLRSGPPFQT